MKFSSSTYFSSVNDWIYYIVSNFLLPIVYSTKIYLSLSVIQFEILATAVYYRLCIDQTGG